MVKMKNEIWDTDNLEEYFYDAVLANESTEIPNDFQKQEGGDSETGAGDGFDDGQGIP